MRGASPAQTQDDAGQRLRNDTRYWRRAIQLTVDLDCRVMNSELNGHPEQASRSEAMFWKSMEELLPVFEREGMELRLEPHPDDFVEDGKVAIE